MELQVVGISHHTAPVEIRELFSLPGELSRRLTRALHHDSVFEEVLVLDTCNRTEVYFVPARREEYVAYLSRTIAALKDIVPPAVEPSIFYHHEGFQAVEHLFRVAGGLDSQVLGEDQVFGQLKTAYRVALEERASKFLLDKVVHRAFRVGKRIRGETHLCRNASSVTRVAVDLAKEVLGELTDRTALLIGAGDNGRKAAQALLDEGVSRILIANRSEENARALIRSLRVAPTGCPARHRKSADSEATTSLLSPPPSLEPLSLDRLSNALSQADLVVCSTGATQPVLTHKSYADVDFSRRDMQVVLDLAVPRDAEPTLEEIPGVLLRNLDDLTEIVNRNLQQRRRELPRAETIIQEEVGSLHDWYDSRQVVPTIKLLQARFGEVQSEQLGKHGGRFADDQQDNARQLARSLSNKILHFPLAYLHDVARSGTTSERLAAVNMIRGMFALDGTVEE